MPSKCLMRIVVAVGLIGLALGMVGCPLLELYVAIPDPNLEAAIRDELGSPLGFLTTVELLKLRQLDARDRSITSIAGLEYCVNLAWLDLDTNAISDLNPLANLTNLTFLNLDDNVITDVEPLAGLLNLNGLSLFNNQISDIQALVANAENGGLGPGDYVILDSDTLSERALTIDVPRLQELGVDVSLVEAAE